MENKFIIDEYGGVLGVEKEKTILKENFNYNGVYIEVLITQEKDYFNIYCINEYFKQEPLNCLQLQEPKENFKEENFNKKYCEFKAIEFYLWFKYGNPSKEEVLSFAIQEFK